MVSGGSWPCRWFSEEGSEAYADSCEQDRSSIVKGEALRQAVENPPEETLVLAGHLAVHAPARLVGRDGVVLHPSAAGEAVEVDARVCGLVHCAHVEAGRVGKRGERRFRGKSGASRAQEREEKQMRPGAHQILAR